MRKLGMRLEKETLCSYGMPMRIYVLDHPQAAADTAALTPPAARLASLPPRAPRHLERQLAESAAAARAGVPRRARAGRALPAGDEDRPRRLPARGAGRGRLRRGRPQRRPLGGRSGGRSRRSSGSADVAQRPRRRAGRGGGALGRGDRRRGAASASVYVPNGRELGSEWYAQKLDFFDAWPRGSRELTAAGGEVVGRRRHERRADRRRRLRPGGVRRGDAHQRARAGGAARRRLDAGLVDAYRADPRRATRSATPGGTTARATSTAGSGCGST